MYHKVDMRRHETSGSTSSGPEQRAREERLRRFVGPIAERDAEVVAYWRSASPSEHARAMIQLSEYAAEMVQLTGFGKDPDEFFPGFPSPAGGGRGVA